LWNWVQDFLIGRPQTVRVGWAPTLNTGAPQSCVLSPLLYSLYTSDCVATHTTNSIVKFADDTAVMGLISLNDERAYLDKVDSLSPWCQDNHLSLNVNKTKELVDFRRQLRSYTPLQISGTLAEREGSLKYLGVHITEDLTWHTHSNFLVSKARQHLYHLRQSESLNYIHFNVYTLFCWLVVNRLHTYTFLILNFLLVVLSLFLFCFYFIIFFILRKHSLGMYQNKHFTVVILYLYGCT
ncbi:hypothetical protein LDENG_00277310, partial [Lucifuga dentata]